MIKYKFIGILLSLGLCSLSTIKAQTAPSEIKVLKVGDQCPDFLFSNIINWNKTEVKLSDLKGKLVILDFWATWCVPCVAALPKLDSLQNDFKENILILPVSYEGKEKVSNFLSNNKAIKNIKLPIITDDIKLKKHFPYRILPHEIWIDGRGKVIAITDHQEVTAKNIKEVIAKGKASIKQKNDIVERNDNKPLIAGFLGEGSKFDEQKIQFQSILTGLIEGINTGQGGRFVNDNYKILCRNSSIHSLYRWAYAMNPPGSPDNNDSFYMLMHARTITDIKSNNLYIGGNQPNEKELRNRLHDSSRLYCYELYVPKSYAAKANGMMADDLNKFFGLKYNIEGVKEKRKVKCWALVRTTNKDLLKSKGGERFGNVKENYVEVRNVALREFMANLLIGKHMTTLPIPIIDETGLGNELVDFEIQANLKDPVSVGKAFQKYGLDFKLVERELDMIIIRDKTK